MIRSVLLALALAAALAALVFARPHATPGPPMRDFEAYYAAAQAWQHGTDPYGSAIWQYEKPLSGVQTERYELLPFVGPPATLPVWSAFARLPFATANAVWRSVLFVSAAVLVLVTIRLCGLTMRPFTFLTVAVFAVGFGPLTSALALGQVALPAYMFAALSLIWLPAGLFAWAQPNVALALLSQARRAPSAVAFAGALGIFVLACIAVVGTDGIERYASVIHSHALAERFSAIQLTPAAIAYGFDAPPELAARIGTAVAIAALAVWLLLMRGSRDNAARFCGTCALLPLAMPFFHEHDLLVTFVPAAYYASRCSIKLWPLAATGALLCATDWLGLAQRPDGGIQTLLLIGAAAVALYLMRSDLPPRLLAVPACMLVAIAVTAAFAQFHPAPVWPDAMGPLRILPAGADAASVWQAEQNATGLLVPNAFWAMLRVLSLTGSIVLVCASMLSSRSAQGSRSPLPAPA